MSAFQLSVLFFFQLALILTVCRVVGLIGRWLGQPPVVCEMIAGVVMGPSLFGLLFPETFALVFPRESMTIIYAVAQVGLALYMFLVGAEFRADLIRRNFAGAAAVSSAGIAAPFALGALIALWLVGDATFFNESVSRWEAMLFLGASMSITAFPMLARIIYERGLSNTSHGTLALAAGSIDDAAAWCVLAVVLASFTGDADIAVKAIGGGVLYAVFCLLILRRILTPLGRMVERHGALSDNLLIVILALVCLGAWFTDAIGIYAVFGAFIMGAAMPRGALVEELHRKLRPLVSTFLLPLFFVYSGLNTRIGLISTIPLLVVAGVILIAATAGKGLACFAAAKLSGETTRRSIAIGALMNARGLMELIILNIGLERGVITPTLFSVMVVMAVVTTLMATPVFEAVLGRQPAPSARPLAATGAD